MKHRFTGFQRFASIERQVKTLRSGAALAPAGPVRDHLLAVAARLEKRMLGHAS